MRSVAFVRRYPLLAGALVAGVVGLALAFAGLGAWAQGLVSAYALGVAAVESVGMVRSLLRGRPGVDLLAVSAILATVLVGEFWAALVIVIMLTGGEALERAAERRARRELSALLERAPVVAHRLGDDGVAGDVPIAAVVPGDRVIVRPGEVVPVDGVLESARASFDESSLTGEPLPVERQAGGEVLSGAVNGDCAAVVLATAPAAQSQYQRIVAMVQEAAESKAPMVRLADRYAVPFTLVAFALAATAWAVSGDPVRFAEVLVVATPCPLLIAAPVAFIAGMSRAARNGIIVKGGGTLEQLARTRTVAFDKTGTLTHGLPEVLAVRPAPGTGTDDLLRLAAAAEQHSTHVLARSIVDAAAARGLDLPPAAELSEVTGYGVVARVAGREVVVGKAAFLRSRGLTVAEPARGPGQMLVLVAVDGKPAGAVVLGDRVRAEARATVARLRRLGVRDIVMLTGDAAATAHDVAASVGITDVAADCLPQDKVRVVREAPRRPVAMVGDGVNDAPVLAAADVGIALGARGATAASESADVVIMLDDIGRAAYAVAIGQRTLTVALQSIWLGIALSVVLMGVAALGFLPAIAGAGLQEVVDLVAILGALRAIGGRADARWRARPTPVSAVAASSPTPDRAQPPPYRAQPPTAAGRDPDPMPAGRRRGTLGS